MSNNIKNIKKSVRSLFTAATTTLSVSTELLADTAELLAGSVGSAPGVAKELLMSPINAATGVVMQNDECTQEQAELSTHKYINQPLRTTVKQASIGLGKVAANLFDDLDEDVVDNANTQTTEQKNQAVIDSSK